MRLVGGRNGGARPPTEALSVFSFSAEQPGHVTSQHTLEEEEGHS